MKNLSGIITVYLKDKLYAQVLNYNFNGLIRPLARIYIHRMPSISYFLIVENEAKTWILYHIGLRVRWKVNNFYPNIVAFINKLLSEIPVLIDYCTILWGNLECFIIIIIVVVVVVVNIIAIITIKYGYDKYYKLSRCFGLGLLFFYHT